MRAIYIALAVCAGIIATSSVAFARDEMFCTMQYQPVCGAKQVQCIKAPCYPIYQTYGNSCVLGSEGATFIHEGECTAAETGPVSGGGTYVPPAHCTAWFDGCNQCGRGADGQAFCTEMACTQPPAPGYCTRYEEQPAPSAPAEEPISTSTDNSSSDTEPTPSGFIETLWQRILSWFTWF